MTDGLRLRPAERRDGAELALLVDLASHSFATWLWYDAVVRGDCDTALEWGRRSMMENDGLGTWKHATMAEWDGDVAGASIGYELDEAIRAIKIGQPALEPLLSLQVSVIGSRFVDSLGVYSHQRGKGIGRALLANELSKARSGRVSLITESHNDTALALYAMQGFTEKERRPAVPLFEGSRRHDWVLLTRTTA